jgi:hypothetical protein
MSRNIIVALIVLFVLLEFLGCLDIALHGREPARSRRQQIKEWYDFERFP